MRFIALLITTVLALGLAACHGNGLTTNLSEAGASGQSAAQGVPQLRRDGRWLVDPQGRVVLLHGVNLVWKTAPFVPPATAEGFTAADASWLADHGFNSARIGTLWVGVSPTAPGVIDQGYLDAWSRITNLLSAHHIWMLFDFHQDMLGPLYQGEGVPDWAVDAVKGSFTDVLGPPAFGFPFNYFTPQVSQAFDNLWADKGMVRDGFRDAWVAVAKRFARQPYSMGYELMNEPWAGLEYPLCLIPLTGCPAHDSDELQPFFEYALAGIRSVDLNNMVWFESQPEVSTGAPTGFSAVPGEQQLGYSFHYYCPLLTLSQSLQLGLLDSLPVGLQSTCPSFTKNTFAQARAQAKRMQAVELLTEFGSTDDVNALSEVTAQADAGLVGWQYWHYKNWSDPTTQSQGSGAQSLFTDDSDLSSVKMAKLKVLERSYPQATAGIPLALSFNPDNGAFSYRYTPKALTAPTEIFVPVAVHYPNGYQVTVTGAEVTSAPDSSLLTLRNLPGASEVQVSISAKPESQQP